MDPLSQAVAGAALAGSFAKRPKLRAALVLGAIAGMAPDLDVLIRSSTDPLLALEYHRHFTHSLAFSPLGGLLIALAFWAIPYTRRFLSFKETYLFCFLGMVTHGILDSCTGYGTHLLWPFVHNRESWNFIGIIDPLYTLPALFLLIFAAVKSRPKWSILALILQIAYISLGAVQHYRATHMAEDYITNNDIESYRLTLRPTIGNLWLWRMLYRDEATGNWQTNALYLPYWNSDAKIKLGEAAANFSDAELARYPADTVTGKDIRRFQFFSDDYLSKHTRADGSYYIGDIRYGLMPDSAQPLWGIETTGDNSQHVIRHSSLRGELNRSKTMNMLTGKNFTDLQPSQNND